MEKEYQNYWNQVNQIVDKHDELINFNNLEGHTIVFIVDMVNGFCHNGKLASPNINQIIPAIKTLTMNALAKQTKVIAFVDAHNLHSPEFENYPAHCLEGSKEAELIAELQFDQIKQIKKNSTNGFFAFDFKPNLQWDNIIIVGCCTDICVTQLALSCRTWFNQHNKLVNIYVPKELTATFDNEEHPALVMNQLAYYTMLKNGIKIIKNFE